MGPRPETLQTCPPEAVVEYVCERSDLTLQLADQLTGMLATDGLESL